MTAGAQQTIPTDIPLHHAGCGPHTAPACLSLLRGPRGETLGVGMAPGWRRGAITDCPGASHSFNIQANPKCRDQGPHKAKALCPYQGYINYSWLVTIRKGCLGKRESVLTHASTLPVSTVVSPYHVPLLSLAEHWQMTGPSAQGRGSLVGCRLWGHTESDTTEVT